MHSLIFLVLVIGSALFIHRITKYQPPELSYPRRFVRSIYTTSDGVIIGPFMIVALILLIVSLFQ